MHLIPGVRGGFLPDGGVWGVPPLPTDKESIIKTLSTVSLSILLYFCLILSYFFLFKRFPTSPPIFLNEIKGHHANPNIIAIHPPNPKAGWGLSMSCSESGFKTNIRKSGSQEIIIEIIDTKISNIEIHHSFVHVFHNLENSRGVPATHTTNIPTDVIKAPMKGWQTRESIPS
jgi:hypothetical protein